jgi:hypothetical protein
MRTTYSTNYGAEYPIKLNPLMAKYFHEENYKNAAVNHAYSFGGTHTAKTAFKKPTFRQESTNAAREVPGTGMPKSRSTVHLPSRDNKLLSRPPTAGSYKGRSR